MQLFKICKFCKYKEKKTCERSPKRIYTVKHSLHQDLIETGVVKFINGALSVTSKHPKVSKADFLVLGIVILTETELGQFHSAFLY